jgi:hypothetical protein
MILKIIKRIPFVRSVFVLTKAFVFFIFIEFPYYAIKSLYLDFLISARLLKLLFVQFKSVILMLKRRKLVFYKRKLILQKRDIIFKDN